MSSQPRNFTARPSIESMLFYSDIWEACESETPLSVILGGQGVGRSVLVSADVFRTYQRMIFELQMQVLRYKTLLEQVMRRADLAEEYVPDFSTPLNLASIETIGSIVQARISEESVLRAYDDEET